jgi:hypothetical protein
MQVHSGQRPGGRRKGEPSRLLYDRALAWTRDASQRQLPTDSEHEGGLVPILEYQTDQPSIQPLRPLPVVHLLAPKEIRF